MILKIERYKNNQRWWIYDDIRKISISDKYWHNGIPELPMDVDYDAVFFDVDSLCKCSNEEACPVCVSYYVLICRSNNGEECSIAFDTVAYLLNDNGKTIEKIVANYDPTI